MRTKMKDGGRPSGFYNAVKERLGNDNVSSSVISMVKRGKRTNDAVLLAVIEVDHNWKEIQHERLKRLL